MIGLNFYLPQISRLNMSIDLIEANDLNDTRVMINPNLVFYEQSDKIIFSADGVNNSVKITGTIAYQLAVWIITNLNGILSLEALLPENQKLRNSILSVISQLVAVGLAKLYHEHVTDKDISRAQRYINIYQYLCHYSNSPLSLLKKLHDNRITVFGKNTIADQIKQVFVTSGAKNTVIDEAGICCITDNEVCQTDGCIISCGDQNEMAHARRRAKDCSFVLWVIVIADNVIITNYENHTNNTYLHDEISATTSNTEPALSTMAIASQLVLHIYLQHLLNNINSFKFPLRVSETDVNGMRYI